ncbi:helix-turn-helix domain-containing protein [Patescibacteria group bacterium]
MDSQLVKNDWYEFAYSQTSELARMFIKAGLPDLLKVEHVALIFQVSTETIRRWEKRGQIQAIRVKRGQRSDRMFKKEEVLHMLNKGLRKNG